MLAQNAEIVLDQEMKQSITNKEEIEVAETIAKFFGHVVSGNGLKRLL